MPEQPENQAPLRCKHDDCDEVVQYVPMVLPGALKRTAVREERERTVYLRCPRGHVHPYRVIG